MTAPASVQEIEKAVRVLRSGGVIAMPTDTLYALSAAASDTGAVRRAFAIKGRDAAKALPLFVAGLPMAERIAVFNETARRLAGRFWPGPLTLVLPRRADFHSEALGGGETVALRVPDHPIARAIIEALDAPVTGTSANRSGGPDPASADEVRRQLGDDVDFVIDAGECPVGVSSTVVDCTTPEPRILRPGAIDAETLANALQALDG